MTAEALLSVYGTIGLIAFVLLATRTIGGELMTLWTMTPRLEAVLKAMGGSVLVAIVAAECARGGLRTGMAVLIAAAVMALSRRPLLAIALGMAGAAAGTWLNL